MLVFGVSAMQGSDGGGRECPLSFVSSRGVVVVGVKTCPWCSDDVRHPFHQNTSNFDVLVCGSCRTCCGGGGSHSVTSEGVL